MVMSSWRDFPRVRGVCNFPDEDFTIHEIEVEKELGLQSIRPRLSYDLFDCFASRRNRQTSEEGVKSELADHLSIDSDLSDCVR